jgi:hypothetical protein
MHDVAMGSAMMWSMGIVWVFVIIALVLGIAALTKFLFFNKPSS